MKARPIRRRDLWRARLTGSPARLRRGHVWGPLLAGLVLVGLAAWWYAESTAFRRRAVTTAAVIDEVWQSAPRSREDGLSTRRFYGLVSYTVGSRVTRSRVLLHTCASNSCALGRAPGDTVEIAYDPRQSSRIVMATEVDGAGSPSGPQTALALMGAVLCAAGGFNLVFGGPPVTGRVAVDGPEDRPG
jgi:hypothetical protein